MQKLHEFFVLKFWLQNDFFFSQQNSLLGLCLACHFPECEIQWVIHSNWFVWFHFANHDFAYHSHLFIRAIVLRRIRMRGVFIKVPNCSVAIRYREIDKDWMTQENEHRHIRGLHQKRGNGTIRPENKWEWELNNNEKKERQTNAHFEYIRACTFAKSTNRASIRYFNLIKFYIQHYAVALIFFFYECRILLSFQTNKIDFFLFRIQYPCITLQYTHTQLNSAVENTRE